LGNKEFDGVDAWTTEGGETKWVDGRGAACYVRKASNQLRQPANPRTCGIGVREGGVRERERERGERERFKKGKGW